MGFRGEQVLTFPRFIKLSSRFTPEFKSKRASYPAMYKLFSDTTWTDIYDCDKVVIDIIESTVLKHRDSITDLGVLFDAK